jgi:DNA-binding NarL/FixJ family response regulator
MRLFIADDSEILRVRLIDMLSEIEGIEIIGQAQESLDAIKSIQELNPHVVILDIRMPRINGIKVLEAIKKDDESPTVIIFTNYPYPQYRKRCMDLGADFFFDKSTEFEKLFDTVKYLTHNCSQTNKTKWKNKTV